MASRNATLDREWEPITSAHERELDRFERSFDRFEEGQTVDPVAVVGAYRSGKTQLMYHMFRESWQRGIPAVYISNPGELLSEYSEASESDIATWLDQRIDEELAAYAAGDADEITWFPNTSREEKERWIAENVSEEVARRDRRAIFVDELEQHYNDFLSAIDTEDNNPLRLVNDELTDTLKVWSFGLLSAYEFLGEADYGRLKEIRIPPLDVADIEERLAEQTDVDADLANLIWWLARGRTGLVVKYIDELPPDLDRNLVDWMDDLSQATPQQSDVITAVWTRVASEHRNDAARAIAFQPDGYGEWMISTDAATSKPTAIGALDDALKETASFPDTSEGDGARQYLRDNVERVVDALSVGDPPCFPLKELYTSDEELESLLSLVESMVLSYEPQNDARQMAAEALDFDDISDLKSELLDALLDIEPTDQAAVIPKPTKIEDAFPSIALNPGEISPRRTADLREDRDRGVEFTVDDQSASHTTIRFCPSEQVVRNEVERVVRAGDLSSPTLLVVDAEHVDLDDLQGLDHLDTFRRLHLLECREHESKLLWDFVLNVSDRLGDEDLLERGAITESSIRSLLEQTADRETQNTVQTLYERARQLSTSAATTLETEYVDHYSRTGTDDLLWEEPHLSNETPFWTNGRISEFTTALSYLLVFASEPDFSRTYGSLHQYLITAYDEDYVGFPYKEFLDECFNQSTLDGDVESERRKYWTDAGQLDDAVEALITALRQLADLHDVQAIIENLNDPDLQASNGQIGVIDLGLPKNASALLRALLTLALVDVGGSSTHPRIDMTARLRNVVDDLEDRRDRVEGLVDDVTDKGEVMSSPVEEPVGSWLEVSPDNLTALADNVSHTLTAAEDLVDVCESEADVRPTTYPFWALLRDYEREVADTIDEREASVGEASVSEIANVRELYKDLYRSATASEALADAYGGKSAFRNDIRQLGDEVFDLQGAVGARRIEIPNERDDYEMLERATDHVVQNRPKLERVNALVTSIISLMEEVDEQQAATEQRLEQFLRRATETEVTQ